MLSRITFTPLLRFRYFLLLIMVPYNPLISSNIVNGEKLDMFAKSRSRRKQHVSEGSAMPEGYCVTKCEPGGPILLNSTIFFSRSPNSTSITISTACIASRVWKTPLNGHRFRQGEECCGRMHPQKKFVSSQSLKLRKKIILAYWK